MFDFGHKFLTAQGTIPRDLMPDFLHLTKRGYKIWAESIEDKLSAVLGDKRLQVAVEPRVERSGNRMVMHERKTERIVTVVVSISHETSELRRS